MWVSKEVKYSVKSRVRTRAWLRIWVVRVRGATCMLFCRPAHGCFGFSCAGAEPARCSTGGGGGGGCAIWAPTAELYSP
jgi:hypothetical protein